MIPQYACLQWGIHYTGNNPTTPTKQKGHGFNLSLRSLSSDSFSLYIPKPEMYPSCFKVWAAVMCMAHECRFILLAPYKSTLHTGTEVKYSQKGNRFKVGLSVCQNPRQNNTTKSGSQFQVDQCFSTPSAPQGIIFHTTNTPDPAYLVIIKL